MKKLLLTLMFSSAVYAQPDISTSEDISVYDGDNDGYALFDLTANSEALLNGLNPNEQTISYHLTFADADANVKAIQQPVRYTNTSKKAQELYARVTERKDPSNYSVDLFSIRTYTLSGASLQASLKP